MQNYNNQYLNWQGLSEKIIKSNNDKYIAFNEIKYKSKRNLTNIKEDGKRLIVIYHKNNKGNFI